MTYSKHLKVPQTQPILGRKDMIKNNAGGYVFQVTDKQQLERFLLCGTLGGTYYVKEQKLTLDNAKVIVNLIQKDGMAVLDTVSRLSSEKRILKQNTAIFVLALALTYGDELTKQTGYKMIKDICKTSTNLFDFINEINALRGWSSGLRKGVANWYLSKSPEQLAYQITKYRDRNGVTHRDVLRLSHPATKSPEQNEVLKYIVGKSLDFTKLPSLIEAFDTAQTLPTKDLAEQIKRTKLAWEHCPTDQLNNPDVLNALLENMPIMALMRNLNRFAYNNMTDGMTDTTVNIIRKLTDRQLIEKSGVHPVFVLNAMNQYSKGRGDKSTKTWNANQRIIDAMETAFQASFGNVDSSDKRILVAIDISGSMDAPAAGTSMTCREVGALQGFLTYKTQPLSELLYFDTKMYEPNFGANVSFREVLKNTRQGGGTDCSLAFQYALTKKRFYDAIVIYTDNETWAGKQHSDALLKEYRKINPDVKVIEIAMEANPYSTLPEDKNLLRIVGYDSAIPELINNFIK